MNEDCLFNRHKKRCVALTKIHCENCNFYKSKQEYEYVVEKKEGYNYPIKSVRKRRTIK